MNDHIVLLKFINGDLVDKRLTFKSACQMRAEFDGRLSLKPEGYYEITFDSGKGKTKRLKINYTRTSKKFNNAVKSQLNTITGALLKGYDVKINIDFPANVEESLKLEYFEIIRNRIYVKYKYKTSSIISTNNQIIIESNEIIEY